MSHYLVLTSQAKHGRGEYRNVAIIEARDGMWPKRIDVRDPAVLRIVQRWGPLHVGLSARSAYHRQLVKAQAYCNNRNANGAYENGVRNDIS